MSPKRLLIIGGAVFLLDQALKYIVSQANPVNVAEFRLGLVANSRGLLAAVLPESFILTVSVLAFAFLFLLIVFKFRMSRLTALGLSIMVAGGLSNIFDRILRGYVADIFTIDRFFFNFADVALLGGVLLVLADVVIFRSKNEIGNAAISKNSPIG